MPPEGVSECVVVGLAQRDDPVHSDVCGITVERPSFVEKHPSILSLDLQSTSDCTYPAELSDSTPDEECSASHLSDDEESEDQTISPSPMAVGADHILPGHHDEGSKATNTVTITKRGGSILKRGGSEHVSPIKESRRAWKKLPPPDMDALRRTMTLPQLQVVDDAASCRSSLSVSFAEVRIRSYDQTVGDNPSVSYGPPITLDWSYEEMEPISIDSYEDARGKRRTLREMILSYYHRRNVLSWQYGISDEELKLAKKQANKVKFERSVTQVFLPAMVFENALQSAGRKAKRLVKGGNSN